MILDSIMQTPDTEAAAAALDGAGAGADAATAATGAGTIGGGGLSGVGGGGGTGGGGAAGDAHSQQGSQHRRRHSSNLQKKWLVGSDIPLLFMTAKRTAQTVRPLSVRRIRGTLQGGLSRWRMSISQEHRGCCALGGGGGLGQTPRTSTPISIPASQCRCVFVITGQAKYC